MSNSVRNKDYYASILLNLKSKCETPQEYLTVWIIKHRKTPYPTNEEKLKMMKKTGMNFIQLNNWLSNARRRILKMGRSSRY